MNETKLTPLKFVEITTKLSPRDTIDKIIQNLMSEYISYNAKFFSDYIAIETEKFVLQFRKFDNSNHLYVRGNEKEIKIDDFNSLYKIIRGI